MLFVRNGWTNGVVEVLVRGPDLVEVRSDNDGWAETLARRLHQGIHSVKGRAVSKETAVRQAGPRSGEDLP